MFFDEAPKRELKDLFNYRSELNQLSVSLAEGSRITVLEGPRRTGKTSLLLTALGATEQPSVVVDARELTLSATLTQKDLAEALERGLNRLLSESQSWKDRVTSALKHVKGVELEPGIPPRVRLTWGRGGEDALDLPSLFDALGNAARTHGTRFIVAFDEAQEFRRLAGLNLSQLLAHVYDYVPTVQLVVTGSQIGVLKDFLGSDDPKAPLFGRALTVIKLGRLTREAAAEYLIAGFRQVEIPFTPRDAATVTDVLDGSIGWLTYVGATSRRAGRFDDTVLSEAVHRGSELAASEFTNFLRSHPQAGARYTIILRTLSRGHKRWSEIKRAAEIEEGRPIPDFNFNQLLVNLVKAGFAEKKGDGTYDLADPLLLRAARDNLI